MTDERDWGLGDDSFEPEPEPYVEPLPDEGGDASASELREHRAFGPP